MTTRKRVLAVCVHNSARSQMVEEYLRQFGNDLFEVESAGIEPGRLNPLVVEVLQEDGIDIAGKQTRSVFDLHASGKRFDYVIAVCDKEAAERCPVFPAELARLHWPFTDPSAGGRSIETVREIRDQIRSRVSEFVRRYRAGDVAAALAMGSPEEAGNE